MATTGPTNGPTTGPSTGESPHAPCPPGWSFVELKQSYNFRHPSDRVELFRTLIADEAARTPQQVRAIDIGCGQGIALDTEAARSIGASVDELWGIEPDKSIKPAEGIFTHFQHASLENADLPADYFDLAYSTLVMEHVQDPHAFFRAVYRALKPGGTHLFLTINGRHYFARITSLLKNLHLDETVLRLVRGRQSVSAYHYPVAYKCNKPREIERVCRETGFEPPEFAFVERHGPAPYFPGPFKVILAALNYKREVIRKPDALLEVIVRVRKPLSARV